MQHEIGDIDLNAAFTAGVRRGAAEIHGDAERAHNESMSAWPQSRRYGHEHLMQIREVR